MSKYTSRFLSLAVILVLLLTRRTRIVGCLSGRGIGGNCHRRILLSVIIPQSWPVIVTVGLFHFVFAWNDYFNPLIYTLGAPDKYVISIGVQVFNFRYDSHPELVQATSMMAMVVPVVLFFFAQKAFMRGVVITGVEK